MEKYWVITVAPEDTGITETGGKRVQKFGITINERAINGDVWVEMKGFGITANESLL